MSIEFLLEVFRENAAREAIVWKDRSSSYGELLELLGNWREQLERAGLEAGRVVSLEADFSPAAVALLLALVEKGAVVVPLTESVETKKSEYRAVAQVELRALVDHRDEVRLEATGAAADHELLLRLKRAAHPGIILFSSGSTGAAKAVVHDASRLLKKYRTRRHAKRTLTFFLFDHIGGLDTLFYTLANGSCVITVPDRSPETVCRAVELHRVEVLPVSPTFIHLLLLSGAHERYDLRSLEIVTYGTEVMPEGTLRRLCEVLPWVRTLQKYGLSEVGTLRSRSRASDSCWVKIGGEGFDLRVVDGLLEIKAESAMLGYLNAPSPFTADGWLRTGDMVEVDGEYLLILGRQSEVINVGGEKFHPAEVEDVVLQMEGVQEASVSGEAHPITGQIVKLRVRLGTAETLPEFRRRLRAFCRERLPAHKIPQRVVLAREPLHGERLKKVRLER